MLFRYLLLLYKTRLQMAVNLVCAHTQQRTDVEKFYSINPPFAAFDPRNQRLFNTHRLRQLCLRDPTHFPRIDEMSDQRLLYLRKVFSPYRQPCRKFYHQHRSDLQSYRSVLHKACFFNTDARNSGIGLLPRQLQRLQHLIFQRRVRIGYNQNLARFQPLSIGIELHKQVCCRRADIPEQLIRLKIKISRPLHYTISGAT